MPQFPVGVKKKRRGGEGDSVVEPAMTTRHVDGAVLAAHHKVVDVAKGEGHGGDGDGF